MIAHMVAMLFMSEAGPKSVGNLMIGSRVVASHMVVATLSATIVTRKGI